jgi:pimeloyl-ACP methyl ester carboxylesterase
VLHATAAMMLDLGRDAELKEEDLKQIAHPVRLCLGDRDTMVTLKETVNVYRSLPNAQLQVFPLTPHPVEQMDVQRLAAAAQEFFS